MVPVRRPKLVNSYVSKTIMDWLQLKMATLVSAAMAYSPRPLWAKRFATPLALVILQKPAEESTEATINILASGTPPQARSLRPW